MSKGCEPRPHYLEKPAIYTRFKTRIINGEAKKSIYKALILPVWLTDKNKGCESLEMEPQNTGDLTNLELTCNTTTKKTM